MSAIKKSFFFVTGTFALGTLIFLTFLAGVLEVRYIELIDNLDRIRSEAQRRGYKKVEISQFGLTKRADGIEYKDIAIKGKGIFRVTNGMGSDKKIDGCLNNLPRKWHKVRKFCFIKILMKKGRNYRIIFIEDHNKFRDKSLKENQNYAMIKDSIIKIPIFKVGEFEMFDCYHASGFFRVIPQD